MKFHNHPRALKIRFVIVFLSTFLIIFSLLNARFLYANVRYFIAPGTIITKDSLGQATKLLPLSKNLSEKPLPDNAHLVIDSIGIDVPIIFGVSTEENTIYKNLEKGVVHYSTTVKPGELGTALILGHSSAYPWYKGKYGSVFALLGKLKPGDKFYVQYKDKRLFVYEVKRTVVFNPFGDGLILDQLESNPKPNLILVSCWPVGTAYRRIAIQAEPVGI